VEENTIMGGAGSAVAESLDTQGISVSLLHLGLPDQFIEHGDHAALLKICGLDRDGLLHAIRTRLSE
jgi:1-deoxy-D-xylulose-5-phosphate synthase